LQLYAGSRVKVRRGRNGQIDIFYAVKLKKLNFSGYFEKEEKQCLELWK